jgi:hypothetical protein
MTVTHRMSKTHPLYERWKGMRARCNNPNHPSFHRYGGRGIRVCARWDDFTTFVADMANCPGVDYDVHRLDNDADYEPGNCVWVHRDAHRAFPKSAEHREQIGAAHRGRRHSREQVERQAAATRAKIDPKWLREAYTVRLMSVAVIAAETGYGKSTVHRALHRHGISR